MSEIKGKVVEVKKGWGKRITVTLECPDIRSPDKKDSYVTLKISAPVASTLSDVGGTIDSNFYYGVRKRLINKVMVIAI